MKLVKAGTDFIPIAHPSSEQNKYVFPACTTTWSKEFLQFTALILFTQKLLQTSSLPLMLGFGDQTVSLCLYLSRLSRFRSCPQISTFAVSTSVQAFPQSNFLLPSSVCFVEGWRPLCPSRNAWGYDEIKMVIIIS